MNEELIADSLRELNEILRRKIEYESEICYHLKHLNSELSDLKVAIKNMQDVVE